MHKSLLCLGLLGLSNLALAASINVVQGKTVVVNGEVGVLSPDGVSAGWCPEASCPTAAAASLVDGNYLLPGTNWQTGTVWWDAGHAGSSAVSFDIDLGGLFLIDLLSIQADNNDRYNIFFKDRDGNWGPYHFTAGPCCTNGMYERWANVVPFEATAFRLTASEGDGYYALSEFRAMGTQIPEPSSLALFGLATALGAAAGKRRR